MSEINKPVQAAPSEEPPYEAEVDAIYECVDIDYCTNQLAFDAEGIREVLRKHDAALASERAKREGDIVNDPYKALGRVMLALEGWRDGHPDADTAEALAQGYKVLSTHSKSPAPNAAALRSEADLYRRQYDELVDWWRGERPAEEYKGNAIEERHARERAALLRSEPRGEGNKA